MVHPMYNSMDSKMVLPIISHLNNGEKMNQALTRIANANGTSKLSNDDADGIITRALVFDKVIKEGNILINIKGSEWESDITKNTFNKLRIKDIKLPFNAGCIKIDNNVIFYSYESYEERVAVTKNNHLFIGNDINKNHNLFKISYMDPDTKELYFITRRDVDGIIREYDNEKDNTEYNDLMSKVMSVLLYISTFKNDVSRVRNKKILGKKNSKRGAPKHTIHQINLTQHVSNENNNTKSSWSSDKRWIVRGHWRNQYYKSTNSNKPKWIDPYWKGSGSELVKKVYNVA